MDKTDWKWAFFRLAPGDVARLCIELDGEVRTLAADTLCDDPVVIPRTGRAWVTLGASLLLVLSPDPAAMLAALGLDPGHCGEAAGGLTRVAISRGRPRTAPTERADVLLLAADWDRPAGTFVEIVRQHFPAVELWRPCTARPRVPGPRVPHRGRRA